jgi:hypothetical protein
MKDFVSIDNVTKLSQNFSNVERIMAQAIMNKYISLKLSLKEISLNECDEISKISKKFNDKLFLGFIGNKDKDNIINLTPDEIRKIWLMIYEIHKEQKIEIEILEEKIEPLKNSNDIDKVIKRNGYREELIKLVSINKVTIELELKFINIMSNNQKYFNVETND